MIPSDRSANFTEVHTMRNISIGLMLLVFVVSFGHADAVSGKTKIAVLDFQLQGDKFTTDDMGAIVA